MYVPDNLGLLETLLCKIITPDGKSHTVRALLDGGSQITVLKRNIANKLNLSGEKRTLVIGTSGAQTLKYPNEIVVHFQLASIDNKYVSDFLVEAITMPKPASDINPIKIDPKKYDHLKSIEFSEELPMASNQLGVELLIGSPITTKLFKELIVGSSQDDLPAAAIYEIGACLTGSSVGSVEKKQSLFASVEIKESGTPIEINKWFSLENLGIQHPTEKDELSAEEQRAESLMEKVTFYDKEKKFWTTRLLWKDSPIQYTNIKRAAVTATRVIKKYSKTENKDAWDSIQKVYDSNLNASISEIVSKQDLKKQCNFHYICMSMVFKPESLTTPVRPVFNANLEYGVEKTSFNKLLMEGRNMLQQLPALMIKFRYYQNVAVLDISKLYSRIRLPPEDADYQRFFWSNEKVMEKEAKANLVSYRQNRLIFGSKSSPYQAQWVLSRHGKLFNNFSLLNNSYLDDIFVGDQCPNKVKKDLKTLIWTLGEGDFPCQKIVSNNKSILQGLDESMKGPVDHCKIYGQNFDLLNDCLTFNFKKDVNTSIKHFTKRMLLSELMKLYDLLGFVQPFHLKAKLIFQECCKIPHMGWDDILPQHLNDQMIKWINELPLLNRIKVQRCFLPPEGGKLCFIASFLDSSNVGLGINTYVISQDKDGKMISRLIFCKARVLPIKSNFTTPRGELVAAELGARAGQYVAEALTPVLGYKPTVYYFSDSEITLFRIKKSADDYGQWVGNRLRKIQKSTVVENWYKVDTRENPADISSRGAYITEFENSELFWYGPRWLTEPATKFKSVGNELPQELIPVDQLEVKKGLKVNACMLTTENNIFNIVLDKFNSWKKIINIVAWCKRFINKLKEKLSNKTRLTRRVRKLKVKDVNLKDLFLLPEEIRTTEELFFKYAQHCEFLNEINSLKEGLEIDKQSKIKKLLPKLDTNTELLLHSSRIAGYKPIILPKDHTVTKLFIHDIHKKFGHSGPSLTLYKTRKRVWIINARQAVKKSLYKCFCRKNILLNERMGKIPSWRHENPTIWSRVGTDVLGPFYVKCNKKDDNQLNKTFAILWTDLVSRGVMVDLLDSADSEGVIRSMRRLTATYGAASVYYSDNGSYYKKASIELKNFMASIDWPKIRKEISKWNAQWIFATAASPFRNATSERMVRSIKEGLAGVIKKDTLTFPELSTVLLEISAYINNRPIGFLSDDSHDDMKPISPSLLTIGREIEIIGDYQGKNPSLKQLYDYRTKVVTEFLKNWSALYLQNLSPTTKWLTKNPYKIKPGMVLFIKDENKLRALWNRGIVTKVIYSKEDNLPRTIELRTLTGHVTRPIQKLAIPEYEILDESETEPSGRKVDISVNISKVAIPEISSETELQEYLSVAPATPH